MHEQEGEGELSMSLQVASHATVSVKTLIGTSPVVALPCVLLQCALWPGRRLPVTHQPLAHYHCCVVMVNLSSNSLWNDRPNSYQQLITEMLGGTV